MQSKSKANKQVNLELVENHPKTFCRHCGSSKYYKKGRKAGKQRYLCLVCRRYFSENFDYVNYKPNYLKLGDDVWDASSLGVKVRDYTGETKLVFLYFQQEWFKDTVKKFIRYQAISKSFGQLQKYVRHLGKFANFLETHYPSINFPEFNRKVIIDFLDFLNRNNLCVETRNKHISTLKTFLEIGNINLWFDVPAYLIRPEDYAKRTKHLPRYIPEEVMQQLNQHLEKLPEPVMRMVLVIQETGLRIGELLQLPINCLKFDALREPYIQYMNWKMNKEDTKPISPELALVIQDQQQYIRQHLGESFEYLFSARYTGRFRDKNPFHPKPKLMRDNTFIGFIKQLAEDFDIKDNLGNRWNFQTHQFRHTVGCRMVNLGVPLHIMSAIFRS